jgi:hypothetical protein
MLKKDMKSKKIADIDMLTNHCKFDDALKLIHMLNLIALQA